jgi:WD repeat and SOF domain-containing protein 1
VQIFDTTRTSGAPTQTLVWPSAIDTINDIKFNQVETSILVSTVCIHSSILTDMYRQHARPTAR